MLAFNSDQKGCAWVCLHSSFDYSCPNFDRRIKMPAKCWALAGTPLASTRQKVPLNVPQLLLLLILIFVSPSCCRHSRQAPRANPMRAAPAAPRPRTQLELLLRPRPPRPEPQARPSLAQPHWPAASAAAVQAPPATARQQRCRMGWPQHLAAAGVQPVPRRLLWRRQWRRRRRLAS